MNWYLQSGKDSDIVMSSKIVFYRNLSGFKFNLNNKEEIKVLKETIKDNLYNIGYDLKYFELNDFDEVTKNSLAEKDLVSKSLLQRNKDNGAILINNEENISILINDEDNIKIQLFSAGFDIINTLNYAIEIDKKIEEIFGYQTSKKFGYLTTDLRNCGTGLRASAILHLPGLIKTGNINKVISTINSFGISLKSKSFEMYEISNEQTLGLTENAIIRNLNVVIQKLIEQEKEARKFLANDNIELLDLIYRSLGILEKCKKIDIEEASSLISNIKLGVDLGLVQEINDLKIMEMILYSKPNNMQKYLGNNYDKVEQDIKRAEVIQEIIRKE